MPKSSLYKEDPFKSAQVGVQKRTGIDWFSILPAAILKRKDISAQAKMIWAAMSMASLGSDRIAMSHHAIAEMCGESRFQVLRCMPALIRAGLVEKDGPIGNQVQPYRILQTRRRGATSPVEEKRIQRPLLTCGKCHHPARGLMKTGWCRSCISEMRVRRIVRDEFAKIA